MSGLGKIALGVLLVAEVAAQGVITTIAGGGGFFRGDGEAAVRALLGDVRAVAVDRAGNVYACDFDHHLVVKIAPDGILTVVAGNGIGGYSGDGGPATQASLNQPQGMAVDAAGNLYIADTNNSRIRKVTAGTITTIAGNGSRVFSGDGGPARDAGFRNIRGLALDNTGNLYIADSESHRIRKVDVQGIVSTVAGSGPVIQPPTYSGDGGPATSASLANPAGVAIDGSGNLIIADTENRRIRKVTPSGIITTIAGNGQCCVFPEGAVATTAALHLPMAVTLDSAGNIYFPDYGNRVRKVTPNGSITTVAGTIPAFSGDGGPATSAALFGPLGIAVDASGNLYVADSGNNRIRRITAGTITTFAGLGPQSFGDGGPATSAALSRPRSLAFDSDGNLYISERRNHRVRRVGPNGVIATVAGNGIAGFSGDGGLAPSAALNQPQGIAFDASGNLYIADQGNQRVRRVTPAGIISTVAGPASSMCPSDVEVDADGNLYMAHSLGCAARIQKLDRSGIITTIAGNGTDGFSGDGGPAIAASLGQPNGIAFDRAGNLYIADAGLANRVRKVTPAGIISSITEIFGLRDVVVDATGNVYAAAYEMYKVDTGGTVTQLTKSTGFAGDGGLAVNALVNNPSGIALDAAGNLYLADTVNDRVRKILFTAPALSLAPASLSFTATAGAPTSAPRQVTVSGSLTGIAWSVQTRTTSGGTWLNASPSAGSTPGTFGVSVDGSTLAPGAYQGTITVSAPLATPPVQTIAVQLTVTASIPAQLSVNASSMAFQALQGTATPPAQFLRIGNAGGGSLSWTAQASTQSGGNWLSVGPGSGSATAAFPATAQVLVTATGLAAGVYSGSIRVTAAALNQTHTLSVTLLVSQPTQTILLSQSGLTFIGVETAAASPSQSFGVLNIGQGTMNWTVDASTLSGGPWLIVTPPSGSSTANSLQIPIVDVRVNLRGLRAGQYSGLIRVNSTGANNSPQFVMVDLNVLPPGSNPGPQVRPTGLIFAALAGGNSPSSQTVRVATPGLNRVEAVSRPSTFDGSNWLEALPSNSVISADDARTITIQPSVGTLAPGVYRGALTLLFADNSPLQAVNVLFVVVSGSSTANGPGAAAACVPQKLLAVHRSLGTSFSVSAARPTAIELQVVDDCGNAISNATVVASFTNGDPILPLASLGNGIYSGTWRPVNAASQVVVTVRAAFAPLTAVDVIAQGSVASNSTAPALFAAGLVNAASFAPSAAMAPGSIISVFGRNLAATGAAASVPLPTTLGGATLSIGGANIPLFYTSDGQINAQLPFEAVAATRPQAVVTRNGVLAVPESITVAAVAPGIFTTNQQGTGQGAILDAPGRLVDVASPVAAGDVVQVYCTGLGLTNPRATTGQAPGALSTTAIPVTATVGGRPATVQFAGLAPGFVGLYQVNVQIPAGVTPGSAVQIILSQGGVPSNTVTLAVR